LRAIAVALTIAVLFLGGAVDVPHSQAAEAITAPDIKPSPPRPVRFLGLGLDRADVRPAQVRRTMQLRLADAGSGADDAFRRYYARRPNYGFSAEPIFRNEDRLQVLPSASESTGRIGELMDSIEVEALLLRVTTPLPF
jgi:hypothetical protein